MLINQVVAYYHETLKQSTEVLAYLETRGIMSAEAIDHFKLGYSNRTLGYRVPASNRKEGAEMRQRLQEIGIYRKSGHEHFNGSLIIPVFDEKGDVTEVLLANTDYFDVVHYAEFHEELMAFIESEKPKNLLVRFDDVQYCSTAIISALLKARHRQVSEGRRIMLCGLSETVLSSIQMLKLDGTVFDICDDEEAALAAF